MMRKQHSPKQEISPMALKRLRAKIWSMPCVDRAEILTKTIIAREGEARATSLALAAMISTMTKGCSVGTRVAVAEAMRNSADTLDHVLERDEIHG